MRDTIREYRGCFIYPRNIYGMYSTYVRSEFVAADTLAGIKAMIRDALKGGAR